MYNRIKFRLLRVITQTKSGTQLSYLFFFTDCFKKTHIVGLIDIDYTK